MEEIARYRGVRIDRGNKKVLDDVSFTLEKGKFYYLVGKVGSGKSSLMKSMYADVDIHKGDEAIVNGTNLIGLKKREIPFLRRKIGIVFQDFQLLQDRSAWGNLEFVLRATGWKDKDLIAGRIKEVLDLVKMGNKGYKMPHELSGGEQQRIVIARSMLNNPELILADEPTGNLDPQTGYHIANLLHELASEGQCVVMATHNLQFVDDFPATVMRCEAKKLYVD